MNISIGAVVLAAGKGTRMHTADPKVLRELLGEPMLGYVLEALELLLNDRVHVVVGHGAALVQAAFPAYEGRFVVQEPQLGTGHALQCAWPAIKKAGYGYVLVINGDVPLVGDEELGHFVTQALRSEPDLAFLTITVKNPCGYGRVVRDRDGLVRIVEAKDYDKNVHGPCNGEINAGVYLLKVSAVEEALGGLTNTNNSGEFYITDLVEHVGRASGAVVAISRGEDDKLLGINTPAELAQAEEALRHRIVLHWLESGVVVRQASSVRIGPKVRLEPGAELCGPCDLLGATSVGSKAVVGPHVWVASSTLAAESRVLPFSHLENASLEPGSQAGPFARLRPGATLREGSRVGNFVEMKKTVLGPHAKAGHLTYLGDAEIGANVNVGAGTITCNYDGVNKHKTIIDEGAFIGSNTSLVAPVTVGAGAVVGAGSVITKNVPDNALAVARGRQITRERK